MKSICQVRSGSSRRLIDRTLLSRRNHFPFRKIMNSENRGATMLDTLSDCMASIKVSQLKIEPEDLRSSTDSHIKPLPVEIFCNICAFLGKQDLKNCRLVSKKLDSAAVPALFDELYLGRTSRSIHCTCLQSYHCGRLTKSRPQKIEKSY